MPTLTIDSADIERMASRTLLSYGTNRGSKQSQFWVLLTLSGVIATAGVASDSTATVIGVERLPKSLVVTVIGVQKRHHAFNAVNGPDDEFTAVRFTERQRTPVGHSVTVARQSDPADQLH